MTTAGAELSTDLEHEPAAHLLSRQTIGWLPAAALGVFSVTSLLRTGVEAEHVARYAAYWLVAVLLPGVIVARSLIGARRNLVEDLSIGAITGIALEVVFWIVGVVTGAGSVTPYGWLVVVLLGASVPSIRGRWLQRLAERVPLLHGWGVAGVGALVLARLDVGSFRAAPLPPAESALFHDLWWHLSLVQEVMKGDRPQVPQVAGESLNYHFFAHVHIGVGSRLSGVLPEVVLLRLWIVPIVLVSVGLAVALGRQLTSSLGAGVITAWLSFAVSVSTYVWVDVTGFAVNPLLFHSPSQLLANACMIAAAIAVVTALREPISTRLAVWAALIVVLAGGAKSTIIPIMIAATLVALGWALVSGSSKAKMLAVSSGLLLVVQGAVLTLASGTNGGTVVVLGLLKSLPAYRGLVDDDSMRGLNDGLLLDSIDSPRTALFALLALTVSLGMHLCRLAGVAMLSRRAGRADLANWWLSAAVLAGFGASLVIDHVGLSQTFFALTVVPLGAAMTVSAIWQAVPEEADRRAVVARGVVVGCAVALLIDYFVRSRQRAGGYGVLDRLLFPIVVLGVILVAALWVWRRTASRIGPLTGLVLAGIIGVLLPVETSASVRVLYRWAQPVGYPVVDELPDRLSAGELDAMVWLRDASRDDEVIITNVHCRPIKTVPSCDARGFWVVGLSGRRSVLEGWGYTNEAQGLQGVDGLVYARQPSPFVERAVLNDAVFAGDSSAVAALRSETGARWIVAVHRAGPVPEFSESVAVARFDNGEVTIFEIDGA